MLNESFAWQADGRIAGVSDNLAPAMGPTSRTASYGYTPSGRVMSGNGPWGNLAYGYDPSGNLTANGGTTMTVSPTSNQVTAVGGTVSRALTYLAGGELAGDAQTGRGALTYSYDAARRMTQVTRGGTTEVGAYAYDFAGQFVWGQTFGAGTPRTAYIHDQAGHVLAEENAVTGAASREYIWLDDKLIELVVVGTTDVPRYVTTGQIDEPQVMTQTSQALAWNGYTDPFGAGTTFAAPATVLNLRLPGQWFRAEASNTGLHQNGARAYDPSLGRYTQPDPLGIDAGANVYSYVDGDPVNEEDSNGEQVSRNLFPPADVIFNYANTDYVPQQFQFSYSVGAHSNGSTLLWPNLTAINPAQLAELIRHDPRYKIGQSVSLGACRIAYASYPQELANILGAPVYAPYGYAWYGPGNEQITSASEVYVPFVHLKFPGNEAGWATFLPIK